MSMLAFYSTLSLVEPIKYWCDYVALIAPTALTSQITGRKTERSGAFDEPCAFALLAASSF